MRAANEDELDALMARLASGDREAFDPLFRALHPRALRLARAKVGDDGAGDAAQAVMLKVFSRASEFEPGRAVLPWFYAVAANEIRVALRARTRSVSVDGEGGEPVSADDDPERAFLCRELELALEGAIASLDGPGAEAICVVLGRHPAPALAPPAFRKRVSRAYAKLRALLGDDDDHER